jgi:hypothetical protein
MDETRRFENAAMTLSRPNQREREERRTLGRTTTAVGGGYFYCERHRKRFQFHKGCPDCQARKPSL